MKAMPATTTPARMTVLQFLAIPETEPGHWELVEGEVVVTFPSGAHQDVIRDLLFALELWRRAQPGRGEVSLEVDTAAGSDSIFGPDLQWWAPGRTLNDPHSRPQPLGDLIVEVRSPSTWAVDVGRKRLVYEREGVQELWLVDPLSWTVLVFARTTPTAPAFDAARDLGPDDTLTSPLLPGFRLPVGELLR